MLNTDTLSSILFTSSNGNQLIYMLNSQLKSLIQNDNSMLENGIASPGIWECKWINDSSILGYSKGQSVWVNAMTPIEIVNSQYNKIMTYVNDNAILKQMMSKINKNDQEKINSFLVDVVEGNASSSVSALFFLGNILDTIQIKVSTVDNNKALPTDDTSCWYDFYIKNSFESNESAMMECLSSILSSSLSTHINEYHISSISEQQLDALGFFKKTPFDVANVKTQSFYDHLYCESMNGFDYVVSWEKRENTWCKKWKSGYLEQGGFVDNNGGHLIDVEFISDFNYPLGQRFYQAGYNHIETTDTPIECYFPSGNRYVITITPIAHKPSQTQPEYDSENELDDSTSSQAQTKIHPYPATPTIVDGTKIYACVDVANMSNSGFSIVNVDTGKNIYASYSWYVAGYCVV